MLSDVPWRDTVLERPLPVGNGFFELTAEPRLGFDLVEEELEKHPGVMRRRAGSSGRQIARRSPDSRACIHAFRRWSPQISAVRVRETRSICFA